MSESRFDPYEGVDESELPEIEQLKRRVGRLEKALLLASAEFRPGKPAGHHQRFRNAVLSILDPRDPRDERR